MEITGKALGPGDYELRSKDFLPKVNLILKIKYFLRK